MLGKNEKDIDYSLFRSPEKNITSSRDQQSTAPRIPGEKGNINSVLDKNEQIVNLSQASFMKEKQLIIQEFSSMQTLHKNQIYTLTEENIAYKNEIERLNNRMTSLALTIEKMAKEINSFKVQASATANKLTEISRENSALSEKNAKLKSFHKQNEEKLRKSLEESLVNYEKLESSFNTQLNNLSSRAAVRPKAEKSEGVVSKEQVITLLTQKKALEDSFAQERKLLLKENSNHLKTISQLKKKIECDLDRRITTEASLNDDIKLLIEDVEKANQEIARLKEQFKQREDKFNNEIRELNIIISEREMDYLESFQQFQEDYLEYQESVEETMDLNEINSRADKIAAGNKDTCDKIYKIKVNIDESYERIRKIILKSNDKLKDLNYTYTTKNHAQNIDLDNLISSLASINADIQEYRNALEKQSNDIFSFFEKHQEELTNIEKENIQKLVSISNENNELNYKLLEKLQKRATQVRLKKNKLPSDNLDSKFYNQNEEDQQLILQELIEQNKLLLQKLTKRNISSGKKRSCELEAWVLREELYKRTIKSLNDQISTITTQSLTINKLKRLNPDIKAQEISQLRKELTIKNEQLVKFEQDCNELKTMLVEERNTFLVIINSLQHQTHEITTQNIA